MASHTYPVPSFALLLLLAGNAHSIYQTAPYDVLATGRYDGNYPVANLTKHGDFGMGTFNGLDGEMVVLDGKVYQNDGFGQALHPPINPVSPFAFVTWFRPDITFRVRSLSKSGLQSLIDEKTKGWDGILAIRVDGRFVDFLGRSFARQIKPYKPLGDIMDRMSLFPSNEIDATFVGFRMPKTVAKGNLNVPGYHFHYVNAERKHGGHVLGYTVEGATVDVMRVSRISLEDSKVRVVERSNALTSKHR